MDNLGDRSVFVTGGTGFIGSRLVPMLIAEGARVTVLTRDPRKGRRRLGSDVELISDIAALRDLRPQLLVNLAGEGIADRPWTKARRRELLSSRVDLTHGIRDVLADAPPAVVVSASAVGYYGPTGDAAFTEDDPPGEGFAAELCRRWEEAALRFEQDGARLVRTRFGLVLGEEGLLARMKLPFSLGLGGRIGDGRQWMSWVHVDDVVAALMRALRDTALRGPVNVTAPEPVTNRTFTRALGKALHRPTPFVVPGFALKATLGQMADELLLHGPRVLPARLQALEHPFRFPEIDPALADAVARL